MIFFILLDYKESQIKIKIYLWWCDNSVRRSVVKNIFWIGLVLLFFVKNGMSDNSKIDMYRDFLGVNGNSIRCQIVKYDKIHKKVLLKKIDKKMVWASLSEFSPEDRIYIKKWICADSFLSPRMLVMSVRKRSKKRIKTTIYENGNKDDLSEEDYNGQDRYKKYEKEKIISPVYFSLIIINKTETTFKNVKGEYFYQITKYGYGGKITTSSWASKDFLIKKIVPGKNVFDTEEIKLESLSTIFNSSTKKEYREALKGILIKVYGPKVETNDVFRVVCFPATFGEHQKWWLIHEELEKTKSNKWELFKKIFVYNQKPKNKEEYATWIKELSVELDSRKNISQIILDVYNADYDLKGKDSLEIGKIYEKQLDFLRAIVWYEKSCKLGNSEATLYLSKIYSSSKDPSIRNGKKAIKYADRVGNIPSYQKQDLFARGYACEKKLKQAVKIQEKVVRDLPKDMKSEERKKYISRLNLYKNGKGYFRLK